MNHNLTATQQTLAKIFSDDYVFNIPGYQRPYAWDPEQAEELLADLLTALDDAPDNIDDSAQYFLGSIVLIKSPTASEATVVDGQQRLTTLTLLLSTIRAAVGDGTVQANITDFIYEKGNIVKNQSKRYRLTLRERDREFFRDYVQHEDGLPKLLALNDVLPDAQRRLRANAEVLSARLAQLDQAQLIHLVQFIITRCVLVTVSTPDLDSAYRIFGVLNSRGLDLSASDILKAEIIGGIPPALRDAYTTKWEDQEEDLGRDAFGDLFSHIRMVFRKAKPQGTLLKEFKQHVALMAEPQRFVDELLMPMAAAFRDITDASYASQFNAEQVNDRLRWINRIEFKDWLPPALAFVVRHRNDPDAMLAFLVDLERLAYSMLACKTGINERIERFGKLTAAIEQGQALNAPDSPLQLSAQEQFATYRALDGALYATHSARAMSVLLLRLNALLSDASASFEYEVVTVEHVMPQQPAPNSQWIVWVPDTGARQQWVHRLGNLVLLNRKKNSAASNRDFAYKKTAYFRKNGVCPFPLTTQVLTHDAWTADVMQERQDELLAKLEAHWRLEGRQSQTDAADALLNELAQQGGEVHFELQGVRHGLSAKARETGDAFTVLAGSMARQEWIGKPHGYQQQHTDLVASGGLKPSDAGPWLVFAHDVDFTSPSAASAVVLGRPDNGRTSWRLAGTPITYAAWQDDLPAGTAASGMSEG